MVSYLLPGHFSELLLLDVCCQYLSISCIAKIKVIGNK